MKESNTLDSIIIILAVVIILIILILVCYFIYKSIKYRVGKNKIENANISNKNKYVNNNHDRVVIFKTHTWNSNIEQFVKKILTETAPSNIDFIIAIHSNDYSLLDKIADVNLKEYIIVFTEKDIKQTYSQGFHSMWASNHWILMWLYHQFGDKYQYYWSVEYDVRIVGDGSAIWNYSGSEDFVYTVKPFTYPNWKCYYIGGRLTENTRWFGYLQLARYSNKFLAYLDSYYKLGENGQDELITYSIFKRGCAEIGLTGTETLLAPLIKNSWSVSVADSSKHKKILEETQAKIDGGESHLLILHPVKY